MENWAAVYLWGCSSSSRSLCECRQFNSNHRVLQYLCAVTITYMDMILTVSCTSWFTFVVHFRKQRHFKTICGLQGIPLLFYFLQLLRVMIGSVTNGRKMSCHSQTAGSDRGWGCERMLCMRGMFCPKSTRVRDNGQRSFERVSEFLLTEKSIDQYFFFFLLLSYFTIWHYHCYQ